LGGEQRNRWTPAQGRGDGDAMKQINVFPMIALLVVVLFLIAWLGGFLQ
jgi:biopolymer transport protein ExbD